MFFFLKKVSTLYVTNNDKANHVYQYRIGCTIHWHGIISQDIRRNRNDNQLELNTYMLVNPDTPFIAFFIKMKLNLKENISKLNLSGPVQILLYVYAKIYCLNRASIRHFMGTFMAF